MYICFLWICMIICWIKKIYITQRLTLKIKVIHFCSPIEFVAYILLYNLCLNIVCNLFNYLIIFSRNINFSKQFLAFSHLLTCRWCVSTWVWLKHFSGTTGCPYKRSQSTRKPPISFNKSMMRLPCAIARCIIATRSVQGHSVF